MSSSWSASASARVFFCLGVAVGSPNPGAVCRQTFPVDGHRRLSALALVVGSGIRCRAISLFRAAPRDIQTLKPLNIRTRKPQTLNRKPQTVPMAQGLSQTLLLGLFLQRLPSLPSWKACRRRRRLPFMFVSSAIERSCRRERGMRKQR